MYDSIDGRDGSWWREADCEAHGCGPGGCGSRHYHQYLRSSVPGKVYRSRGVTVPVSLVGHILAEGYENDG